MLMVHSAMAAMTGAGISVVAAPGQQLFTAGGSFVVPAGVTSICVVAIGAGCGRSPYSGGGYWGGAGGGLAYVNAITVTSGETLTVQVVEEVKSQLLRGGIPLCAAGAAFRNVEFDGGPTQGEPIVGTGFRGGGGQWTSGTTGNGGGAGGYTSAGGFGGTASRGGGGSSPLGGTVGGAGGGAPGSAGGTYGGGSSGSSNTGGPGCVRIIWGEGRTFPNTNTGDL